MQPWKILLSVVIGLCLTALACGSSPTPANDSNATPHAESETLMTDPTHPDLPPTPNPDLAADGGESDTAESDVDSNYVGLEGAGQLLGSAPAGFVALEVNAGAMRVEDTGFVIIPGLVQNPSSGWVRSLNVHILIYDGNGQLLREELTLYALLDSLPPQGTSAFRLTRSLDKLAGVPARFEIEAFGIPTADPGWQVAVTQVEAKADGGDVAVSGEFRNTGLAACAEPQVAVAILDGDTVVEAELFYLGDSPLAAGDHLAFNELVYGVAVTNNLRVIATGTCKA